MREYKNRHTVGITGHRDLKKSEIENYKEKIKNTLKDIQQKSEKPLLLVSPLADGADRLFVYAGLELGLEYASLFPLPLHMYTKDFSSESLEEFNSLLTNGINYDVCGFAIGNDENNCQEYGENRDIQYLQVGKEISKCNELIALWDGVKNNKVGGTSNVIHIRKSDKKYYNLVKVQRE